MKTLVRKNPMHLQISYIVYTDYSTVAGNDKTNIRKDIFDGKMFNFDIGICCNFSTIDKNTICTLQEKYNYASQVNPEKLAHFYLFVHDGPSSRRVEF